MKKQNIDEDLIEKIDEILSVENRPMSIREIKTRLEEVYGIEKSPQIVLRHLNILKSKKKAREI